MDSCVTLASSSDLVSSVIGFAPTRIGMLSFTRSEIGTIAFRGRKQHHR